MRILHLLGWLLKLLISGDYQNGRGRIMSELSECAEIKREGGRAEQ